MFNIKQKTPASSLDMENVKMLQKKCFVDEETFHLQADDYFFLICGELFL